MNHSACQIIMYFRTVVGVCSPWYITGIAVEKYIAIRFPLRFIHVRTRSAIIKFIVGIFVIVSITMTPIPFNISADSTKCLIISETSLSIIYSYIMFVFHFFLPIAIVGVLNVPIIKAIKRSHREVLQFLNVTQNSTTNVSEVSLDTIGDNISVISSRTGSQRSFQDGRSAAVVNSNPRIDKSMMKLFFVVAISNISLTSPFYFRTIYYSLKGISDVEVFDLTVAVARTMMISNYSLNFYLYLMVSDKFRSNLKNLFCGQK